MKKLMGLMIAGLAVSLLSGCLDVTSVVAVKKDGSGTITDTVYFGAAMMGMMNQMAGGMGGQAPAAAPSNPFDNVDEDELRDKAADRGDGVTYVSNKKVKKADGSEGLQVVYAFKDINKLKMSLNPDTPGGGPNMAADNDNPVTFKMTQGAFSKLVITMPKPKKDEEEGDDPEEMGQSDMQDNPQAKAMMKQMFNGFRFRMLVKLIDGEIVKSNATYQGLDPQTKKRQYITLMDMDLGAIMQDDAQLDKLAKLGEMKDMVEAKEKMKDIKGLKVETAEVITVEIK